MHNMIFNSVTYYLSNIYFTKTISKKYVELKNVILKKMYHYIILLKPN